MVLVVGGMTGDPISGDTQVASAELYDRTSGTFSYTGSLNIGRTSHSATLLSNGMVLVTGGRNVTNGELTDSELYDPSTGMFSSTGALNTGRDGHTATLLNDGTVLIAGGQVYQASTFTYLATSSAEIYDPTIGTFATTGNLNTASFGHSATLLNTGKVLIAGGAGNGSGSGGLARTEVYDPIAKSFAFGTNLSSPRGAFAATLLSTGQVLLVGGCCDSNNHVLASADLYDPTTATVSIAGNLNNARLSHTVTSLGNGMILIAGGSDQNAFDLTSAETYQSTPTPPPPASLQITPGAANIPVGATQQFTAVDNQGYPRLDVTWTVSDPTIASVTTNDENAAIVTGIAAGQVTLTANAEGVTAQEQVAVLSPASYTPGTTIWSAPPPAGYSVQQLAQAVPSATGPDLYSISTSADGTQSVIQALKADGERSRKLQHLLSRTMLCLTALGV